MKMHALQVMAAVFALALIPTTASAHGGFGGGGRGGFGGGGFRGGGRFYGGYGGFYGGYYDPFWDGGYYPNYDSGYPYYSIPAPINPTPATVTLVAQVQQKLSNAGYYQGAMDGVIGQMTRDAIARYQSDHKMPVTSSIDETLLRSLGLI